jgi:PAS domain S-box-containing protein
MSRGDRPRETADVRTAKLDAILSTAVNAIVTIDSSAVIESINPATTALFGYSEDELIGRNVKLLMPASYAAEHDEYLSNYLRSGVKKIIGFGREVAGRRKDGTTFPIHLEVSEFEVGGFRHFVGVITDLSERKAIAAAADQALEESDRRLVQAQKMEAVGQLAGGIAHDFNNLLTVIIGNLELVEPSISDADTRARLKQIQDAAESGSSLTHRLLGFSRQLPLDPQILQVNSLMVRTADLLRRTLGDHITLATTLAPDLWSISTDPAQIESALTNLAINARDAMPNGGRLIIETRNAVIDADQIATGLDMKPGEYVAVSVSDTGTGIPPELRDRVFEPFFTTKEQRHGSGLGLAMIYGFVKQSGGHVTLYSEMGHGTTITMYLPRAEPVLVATEAAERRQIQATPGNSLILVVEDDDGVRQLTVTRLRHLGYQVAEASDGVKALAMLRAGLRPALVFSDAIMPGGISGREVLEQAVTVLPSVKLLLTSGYADDWLDPDDRSPLPFKLLRKPHRLTELADAIRDALA